MSQNQAKTIVITRPPGDEAVLRDELLERGYHAICEPLTEIMLYHNARFEVEQALLCDPDAVIVTSKHAVQALAMLVELRDMFLLCVGEATENVALQLGFTRVSAAGGTVEAMTDYIFDCYDNDARFLYISGEHIGHDLSEILAVHGMEVERVVVYEAIACEALSDTLVEQIKRGVIDAVTFFSPRSGQIFLKLAEKHGVISALSDIHAFCLSNAVAESIDKTRWRGVYVAAKPTLASLAECIDIIYGNNKREENV